MSRKGIASSCPCCTTRICPACSTTNRRAVSPGGAVRYTGLESPLVTMGTSRRLSLVGGGPVAGALRSEEHTSELQSLAYLVCRLLLEKKKNKKKHTYSYRRSIGRA